MLAAESDTNSSNLDPGLVPWPVRRPVYLRLTDTPNEARDYAAAGFHVCVIRGLAGGCSDPADGFANGGTDKNAACKVGLNRPDVMSAWDAAAGAYREAYAIYAANHSAVEDVKAQLRLANAAADAAYGLEGITPPADPGPGARTRGEGVADGAIGGPKRSWKKIAIGTGVAVGCLGLIGLIGLSGGKKRRSRRSARTAAMDM